MCKTIVKLSTVQQQVVQQTAQPRGSGINNEDLAYLALATPYYGYGYGYGYGGGGGLLAAAALGGLGESIEVLYIYPVIIDALLKYNLRSVLARCGQLWLRLCIMWLTSRWTSIGKC